MPHIDTEYRFVIIAMKNAMESEIVGYADTDTEAQDMIDDASTDFDLREYTLLYFEQKKGKK